MPNSRRHGHKGKAYKAPRRCRSGKEKAADIKGNRRPKPRKRKGRAAGKRRWTPQEHAVRRPVVNA